MATADVVVIGGGVLEILRWALRRGRDCHVWRPWAADRRTGNEPRPLCNAAPHRIARFGPIDPLTPAFLQHCADARSGKITG